MSRFSLRATLTLTILLSCAFPVMAQRRGGGGSAGGAAYHGGSGYQGGNGYYRRGGYYYGGYGGYYPYGGFYPGYLGINIGLGYDYGPGPLYPNGYAPPVLVPPPPPLPPVQPAIIDNTASIHVLVPADAAVWFNGAPTTQTGAARDFTTPPLPPGKTLTYEVKARWMKEGKPVESTVEVQVVPNKTTTVDFAARPPARG